MSETFKNIAEQYAILKTTGLLVENKKNKKEPHDLAADIVKMLQTDCHFVIEEK
jgi:hypothetical protein